MKQYINFKVRQGGFTNMVKDFGPWVTQKMPTQAPRIIEWMNENQGAVSALFSSFVNIAGFEKTDYFPEWPVPFISPLLLQLALVGILLVVIR